MRRVMSAWVIGLFGVAGPFLASFLLVCATPAAATAAAQKTPYPTKPVKLLVPLASGSTVERAFRAMAESIKPFFPQPIAVVARPGGGGGIGIAEVVTSKPDGYTVGGSFSAALAILPNMSDVPYKMTDYQMIANLISMPAVFAVRQDAPWKTMKDLLDYAKSNPGKIRVGTSGSGTGAHFSLEAIKDLAKVDLTHVPYDGDPPSVAALLGGHQEVSISVPGTAIAQIEAKKVRALATTSAVRSLVLPDVPTLKELGYDYTRVSLIGLILPKDTPDYVGQTLHDAFKKAIETDSFKALAKQLCVDLDYRGPAEAKKQLEADNAYYRDLVKKLGLKK